MTEPPKLQHFPGISPVDATADSPTASHWMLVAVLMLLTLLARSTGLMMLPLFGDEGIYLRWTQLIRQAPSEHLFVSLADPKPPLHYWLMALAWPLAKDPLWGARLLSVLAGVLLIPGVVLLCRGMAGWLNGGTPGERGSTGRMIGLIAALLAMLCPFLAFYQRLATADALFVTEMVWAAWLSVRMGLAARHGTHRGWLTHAIPLGLLLGLAMLTRQIVSYELWALPAAAFWLTQKSGRTPSPFPPPSHPTAGRWGAARRMALWLLLAGVIGGGLWSPFLLAQPARYHEQGEAQGPVTGSSISLELKRRILYQAQFSESKTLTQRAAQVKENLLRLAVPRRQGHLTFWGTAAGDLQTGWYWVHLTPPVFLLSLLALVWLGLRGQWRWLVFLGLWLFLMIGPLVLVGDVARSRYTLAGVPPLLVALAYLLTDWITRLLKAFKRGWMGGLAAGVLAAGVLAWPAYSLYLQSRQWAQQPMVAADRYEYVTGWTAGQATMTAIREIETLAANGNEWVVITSDAWGNPADAAWVYLSGHANIRVYYRDGSPGPILQPAGEHGYRLRDGKWLYRPEQTVTVAPETPVLYITGDPVHTSSEGDVPALKWLRRNNAIVSHARFENPDGPGEEHGEGVVVVPLQ